MCSSYSASRSSRKVFRKHSSSFSEEVVEVDLCLKLELALKVARWLAEGAHVIRLTSEADLLFVVVLFDVRAGIIRKSIVSRSRELWELGGERLVLMLCVVENEVWFGLNYSNEVWYVTLHQFIELCLIKTGFLGGRTSIARVYIHRAVPE